MYWLLTPSVLESMRSMPHVGWFWVTIAAVHPSMCWSMDLIPSMERIYQTGIIVECYYIYEEYDSIPRHIDYEVHTCTSTVKDHKYQCCFIFWFMQKLGSWNTGTGLFHWVIMWTTWEIFRAHCTMSSYMKTRWWECLVFNITRKKILDINVTLFI